MGNIEGADDSIATSVTVTVGAIVGDFVLEGDSVDVILGDTVGVKVGASVGVIVIVTVGVTVGASERNSDGAGVDDGCGVLDGIRDGDGLLYGK